MAAAEAPPMTRLHLTVVLVSLVFLGCVNFCLLKMMYSAYGDGRAFFVNQGVNFLYVVYGAAVLYPRMWFTSNITEEMRQAPKGRFVAMGVMDAFGTFFTAMGSPYTPGSLQPLLNQLLIPFTLIASMIGLGKRYAPMELSGALLITVSACVSAMPQLLADNSEVRAYSVCLYALSSVPMACSAVYKQGNFRKAEMDVWYLTQWVSVVQFFVSFLFMPVLMLPGFGSQTGMSAAEVGTQFMDGLECYLEQNEECRLKGCFWLLTGYCAVNVSFNVLGLYLTKVGSALLNAISYALLLPITTFLFFTPLVGAVQEPVTIATLWTVVGLVGVLAGFALYQRYSRRVDKRLLASPGQPAFQERIVGMGAAHARLCQSLPTSPLCGAEGGAELSPREPMAGSWPTAQMQAV